MERKIKLTHKDNIKAGDTILRNGFETTVSNNDIKYSDFMGVSLFGDSYSFGHELVEKVIY